ncbi:hypothetical protein EXT46_05195 [Pseudoalteromonas sp. CO325X]|uniref:RNA-directed DNA polymerase n=1 Tax=Pseudoalteromonas sp. CO325X TaxID=1777262 RepID=UPI001022B101|nr:reverse transcriptase domain-containing protein [Pseudoalteromonas sp. CO325X]RZF83691.1 hypothetical protein EXT46_05195 [Pseudoalteromonas sp. CO325X]
MLLYKRYGELLCKHLATNQNHYVEQQSDGSYHKRAGVVNPNLIQRVLSNQGSIAVYQKNADSNIKWICFDFDILKKCIGNDIEKGLAELNRVVTEFCNELSILKIPYLLEYSGNRGFHVWITFEESINYRTGYDIQQAILNSTGLEFDSDLVGLDRFPHSASPTGGVGKGVKIPLSKHKKSATYSYLIENVAEIKEVVKHRTLNESLVKKNIKILESHTDTSKSYLESAMGVFFESYTTNFVHHNRVKSIKVVKKGFELKDVLELWKKSEPLKKLAIKIENKESPSHSERVLLVGLFCNIDCKGDLNLGEKILHDIFSLFENYDFNITSKAINSLRSFNFPTQEQVESTLKEKFQESFTVEQLIKSCIPKYLDFEDASFHYSKKDIEITRAAEINYLFLNDEVQSKTVIEELCSRSSDEYLYDLECLINGEKNWSFYRHERNEGNKIRELITLSSTTRVSTSTIIKQIAYYLDIKQDDFSHGYQISKGYSGGYIFKPWLFLWLKFISNITDAIENRDYRDFYIVKTDIKNFYDNIPHDSLKRLLLGDGDSSVRNIVSSMKEETKYRYKKCLEALFSITRDIVGDSAGLPQGPAYARFFAEFYLIDLDKAFKEKFANGEILLYQRYVDDIFFIAKTKYEAESLLSSLKSRLELLNLHINEEKTVISKISSFHEKFNKYRSQSKYTIDQVTKAFSISSDKQKDMAINEFVSLIQSDSCQEDLSFIFSHLDGVKELDELKTEQILPALKAGTGRGSLYKNLFNFIFELNPGWEVIYKIEKYDVLQSEVLTSCLINALELNKDKRQLLKPIAEKLVASHISTSQIVEEHMAYMVMHFGCSIDYRNISPKYFIKIAISSSNLNSVIVNLDLLSHLNIHINDMKSLPDFIKLAYFLSYNESVNKDVLKNISQMFFAKMSIEYLQSEFSPDRIDSHIIDIETANKLYYLLCLFSTSDHYESNELIESMWRYCTHLFNELNYLGYRFSSPNWLEKLGFVDINLPRANWIISSIVDGNIFRGGRDNWNLFEKYHNALLVFLTISEANWKFESIQHNLAILKDKSNFYNWLIESEQVSIFPNSKKWFERNIIENGITALKKEDKILIRKPTNEFLSPSNLLESSNGFSECTFDYNKAELTNLSEYLLNVDVKQKFSFLIDLLKKRKSESFTPIVFCPERVLSTHDLSIFSNEFNYKSKIIIQDEFENVTSLDNSEENLINAFLLYLSQRDDEIQFLNDKYFNKLDGKIDRSIFISKYYSNLLASDKEYQEYFHDIAFAAALYIYLSDLEPLQRLEKFVNQYQEFFNDREIDSMHIFSVDKKSSLSDENPKSLLNGITRSLSLITGNHQIAVPFYLGNDVEFFLNTLDFLVENSELSAELIGVEGFRLSEVSASLSSRSVKIDSVSYSFNDVKVINPTTREIVTFELRHMSLINGSDHVYSYIFHDNAYIISINSYISVMYNNIVNRYESIIIEKKQSSSLPILTAIDSSDLQNLNGFDDAAYVIKHHRGIKREGAERLLKIWLSHLPSRFHQPLVTLVQAHEVMLDKEIDGFIEKVKEIDEGSGNLFLIKNVDDYNGTHRILYRDESLGRGVSTFTPVALEKGVYSATLVVDLILTGFQIRKAMEYYLGKAEYSSTSKYFHCDAQQREELIKFFKELKILNICTVLYTKDATDKIEQELRQLLGNDIQVNIVYGRNIKGNAFFASTQKISESDKNLIRSMLKDEETLSDLYDYLSPTGMFNTYSSDEDIDKMNLVARYKSLPKKSFDFLRVGLKIDPNCRPLDRVLELSDKL